MDDQPNDILSALQEFIAKQQQLLQRTKSDIDRLKNLRADVQEDPLSLLHNLGDELNDTAYKLSADACCFSEVPSTLIERCGSGALDPIPLNALATKTRNAYAQRNHPHTRQRSDLSDLQRMVKDAKRRIIDPVFDELARLGYLATPADEAELELARAKERAKMARVRERTIKCGGLRVPTRPQGNEGVMFRQDMEDESGVVEISLDDPPENPPPQLNGGPRSPPPVLVVRPPAATKPSRSRRATAKARERSPPPSPPPKKKPKLPEPKIDVAVEPKPLPGASKRSRDTGKPKPETYKQAWSVEEQHLLERLLDEIPDGEKNRWQKISRAMDGRRTPRQVASRVQKYFEKLKRFGVEDHNV